MEKAFLILEDGKRFEGVSIGNIGNSIGELCFNTGMTGYQEIFTDPSYANQLVLFTNVHMGNYGIHPNEFESSSPQIKGLIVRNFEETFSRSQCSSSVNEYLVQNNIVGIANVDTRAIVRYLREKGAMMGAIVSDGTTEDIITKKLVDCDTMEGLELASTVSTKVSYIYKDNPSGIKIAVLDFGVKKKMLDSLAVRGFSLKVFPSNSRFEDMEDWKPDGYFLSNGPGDPSVMSTAIETAKNIFNSKKPTFGICLGHQVLCLAKGLSTFKMHHGHRGLNHPVINLVTGRSEITSQNHGFAVDLESANIDTANIKVTHVNLNDNTLEGVKYVKENAFSVQYHPEASPGPHDSRYLFDDFKKMFKN